MAKWFLKRHGINTKELAKKSDVSEVVATILANRGIKTPEDVRKFMNASLEDLYSPHLMMDMDKGTQIIIDVLKQNKKLVIYGDYDADGVISTYILYSALLKIGQNVSYYIPSRETEGYGMNSERIKKLYEEGYEAILTCDNGIAAMSQIEFAKSLNMIVVVTDHHDIPFIIDENGERKTAIPPADAIINPNREECSYPFKKLCGAGIAFKLIQNLYEKLEFSIEEAYEFIEYVSIATLCDVVDLIDENRIITKNGLKLINKTKNLGIKALIKEVGLQDKIINSYHIGFILGPAINATGRLESADISMKLLLSENPEEAEILSKKLHELNIERQALTQESTDIVVDLIENSSLKSDKILLIFSGDIHESIAGIVAGRIKEKYNRPTIVLTKGSVMPKGSGRSIDGYNMFEELMKCKSLIKQFGGHPMAAGLSIEKNNIEPLRKMLNANCKLNDEDMIPKVRIDKQLNISEITYDFIRELDVLEPFGKGNAAPIFGEKNIQVLKVSLLGKNKNVLRFICRMPNTNTKISAVCFDGIDKFREEIIKLYGEKKLELILNDEDANIYLDIVFSPNINEFNGRSSIQLQIKDFRIA
jgi:single-stranded-DNA-specific exonuclease